MKQQLLRTVSTYALVLAMGGAAFAQTGGSGGGSSPQGGPSATPQTQQQKPDTAGGAAREGRPDQGGSSGETVQPRGGSAERPSERQPGATQRSDERTQPRKQDRSDTRDEQKRTPRASGKDDGKRAGERSQEKDRARTGQGQRGEDRDRTRTGQDQRERDDRRGQADRDRGKDADRQRQGAQQDRSRQDRGGATQLSEQQRTTVRERFSRSGVERNRETNVNFDIRIGASVPRSVTLHALPADVIEVVPAYRSYRYVYVRDEIVIVDPASYEVVAVVSGSGRTAGVRDRRLTLGAPDRVFVREHIDRGASIRLGIGGISVGMTIPQGVALLPLPGVVVERYPDLRDYRYFVYEDDIALVDPSTDEVVMIIED